MKSLGRTIGKKATKATVRHSVRGVASKAQRKPMRSATLLSVALRIGLRCAFEATPRTECRTVAFVAFFPIVRPRLFIDASVFGDRLFLYPAGGNGHVESI